jgi:molecular chaperone Hsp33
MVTAHPDIDMAWFEGLTEESVRTMDQTNTLSLLERRIYRWDCGCNDKRMMSVLTPLFIKDPEALFGDEPLIRMSCPRCGAKYVITREAMEASTHFQGLRRPQAIVQHNPHQVTENDTNTFASNAKFNFKG